MRYQFATEPEAEEDIRFTVEAPTMFQALAAIEIELTRRTGAPLDLLEDMALDAASCMEALQYGTEYTNADLSMRANFTIKQLPPVRFVVVDENVFGYIDEKQPDTVGILATALTRGALFSWKDGTMPLPQNPANVRPATRADFDTYRISTAGYENNPHYDFPRE